MIKKNIIFICLLLFVFPLAAEETSHLVIYSNQIAQVFSQQTFSLNKGNQTVGLQALPGSIISNSLRVAGMPGLTLESVSFKRARDVKAELYKGLIGEKVFLLSDGKYREVKVLASGAFFAVEEGGRILLDPPGTLVLPVPMYDRIVPLIQGKTNSLVDLTLNANKAQSSVIPFSYIAAQLSWKMIYKLNFDEEKDLIDLESLIQINNNTDIDFRDSAMSVVAGNMNFERGGYRPGAIMLAKSSLDSMEAPPEVQAIGDYYRLDLPGLISLASGEELQVNWLSKSGIKVDKKYQFSFSGGYMGVQKSHAQVLLLLSNSAASNMAFRIPAGEAYVYSKKESGALLAKVMLPALTIGESTQLNLGDSLDLYAEKTYQKRESAENNSYIDYYELKLTNSAETVRKVEVSDKYYGNWQVLKASHEYLVKDANTLIFSQTMQSGQTLIISYQIKTK